jgi:transposase-like protein
VLKFGPVIARNLRAIRPKAYTRWHLDEMVASLSRKPMYLWRAVDGKGEVLEILVQPKRDKAAAIRLLRKLLRRQGFVPTVSVTDKLRSYGAALREIGFFGSHKQGLRANNRAENSHQPIRRRGTKDAGVQISQICAALRFRPCRGLQHIQCSTAFDQPSDASMVSNRRASILECGDSCCSINLGHLG